MNDQESSTNSPNKDSRNPEPNQHQASNLSTEDPTAAPSAEETKPPSHSSAPASHGTASQNSASTTSSASQHDTKPPELPQSSNTSHSAAAGASTSPSPSAQSSSHAQASNSAQATASQSQTSPPPQQQSSPPPQFSAGQSQPVTQADVNNWAMFLHLSGLITLSSLPLGFLGPLIIWLIQKERMPQLEPHFKAAINFQISWGIGFILSWILIFVSTLLIAVFVGLLLLPLSVLFGAFVLIGGVIVNVIAGIKASSGEYYRYPMTFEFIK